MSRRATSTRVAACRKRFILPRPRMKQLITRRESSASTWAREPRTHGARAGKRQMDSPIDVVGVRVIGSLIEKEITTADNYPLTLNAVTAACNQTSNREPVLDLDEATVLQSVDDLSRRSLVRSVHRDSRARRYRHLMSETLNLHPAEIAIMCVLLLRGPQTTGEIRTRSTRLFEVRDLPHVEVTLQSLMPLSTPLVAQLPRRPGQKEVRFAHLLSGEPQVDMTAPVPTEEPEQPSRIDALEQEVASLRAEMVELRTRFEE